MIITDIYDNEIKENDIPINSGNEEDNIKKDENDLPPVDNNENDW